MSKVLFMFVIFNFMGSLTLVVSAVGAWFGLGASEPSQKAKMDLFASYCDENKFFHILINDGF